MTLDNALRKLALTNIKMACMGPLWCHKFKWKTLKNTTFCQYLLQSMFITHCNHNRQELRVKGSCITGNLWCSRRWWIDGADSYTAVVMIQCAANCLNEAVCKLHQRLLDQVSIITLWSHFSPSTLSISSRPVLVWPLFSNSHDSGATMLHAICCCIIGKSSSTKINDSPPFKLWKLINFRSLSSTGHCYASFKHAFTTPYLNGFSLTTHGTAQSPHIA